MPSRQILYRRRLSGEVGTQIFILGRGPHSAIAGRSVKAMGTFSLTERPKLALAVILWVFALRSFERRRYRKAYINKASASTAEAMRRATVPINSPGANGLPRCGRPQNKGGSASRPWAVTKTNGTLRASSTSATGYTVWRPRLTSSTAASKPSLAAASSAAAKCATGPTTCQPTDSNISASNVATRISSSTTSMRRFSRIRCHLSAVALVATWHCPEKCRDGIDPPAEAPDPDRRLGSLLHVTLNGERSSLVLS